LSNLMVQDDFLFFKYFLHIFFALRCILIKNKAFA
jgi:hypothetical protein